ncbi:MAG: DUF374 domain-containing protein [Planctomycetes bacterium]|nr:DUF374 domain-containing protein [Planctomycetota bacterium]
MSVASGKVADDPWAQWLSYRHYGEHRRSEFSLRERATYAATSAATRLLIRIWTDTCRWDSDGDQSFRHDLLLCRRNFIFVLWHNRVPAFFAYLDTMARRDPRFRADSIVSASKDGEFLARPIRENGGMVIRGSSSRDAAKALRGGVAAAAQGASIATVGDGPRGPRYKLKPGCLLLAKATGLPIVPLTWACNRVVQLHRSWDQLMLPLPFSRLQFRFGEPLSVPQDADARAIARARRELEQRLHALTKWADNHTGVSVQIPKPKPGELLKRRPRIELEGRHFEDDEG